MTQIYSGGGSATGMPGGVKSFGVPVFGSLPPSVFGNYHFVDGNLGADGTIARNGGDRDAPLKTMSEAFSRLKSGDVIYFRGNITENLTAPAGIFDVTIIGCGNRPRHADAHTGNNGYSGATWKASVTSDPLLIVRQQGWRFFNILFACPTTDCALEFIRDAASGDSERDSSHAEVAFCRFASGQEGIKISGTEVVHNLHIHDNIFNDQTTAIKGSAVADYARRLLIEDNTFMNNTNHIVCGMYESVIRNNSVGKFTTGGIDLRGGSGGLNLVHGNALSGTYSNVGGYYVSAATDDWGGNFNSLAGGVTASDPA